jgi:hypothetical protein
VAIRRMQCSFGADTAFPRDRMTITPHFKVTELPLAGHDDQGLTNDLANALNTWLGNSREVVVKCYDAQKPKPNPPTATKTLNAGLTPASPGNRETSLCLSYYADSNVPRRRDRLYIPAIFLTTGTLPVRPTQAQRDQLQQFVTIFANLGGVDVDWVVWSRAGQQAHTVTNWFVDDEWDTQRRRGLRPTTRSVGTTSG